MNGQSIRILVVDDNCADVEIVRRMLCLYNRAKFVVSSVNSVSQCLRELKNGSFDLILLDYRLPGEDGLTFLREIDVKEMPPVIMLTGQGDERVAAEAMRYGAYDYFPKSSITSGILARAIHQAMEKHELDRQIENTEQVVFTLAAAVEAKDSTTGEHLQNMTRYAGMLGEALGLEPRDLLLLKYGAILHDIGKVGVSEAILCKPGPLNEEEWAEMRTHPLVGEKICGSLRFAREVGPVIRHHHERWDGGGYVDGIRGEEIPFLARVIAVVDAYDAMSSDRPYRAALPPEERIRRLSQGAGTQWDPDVVETFLRLIRKPGRLEDHRPIITVPY